MGNSVNISSDDGRERTGLSVVFVRSGSLAVSGSSAVFSGIADVEILEGLVAVISKVSEAIIESKRKSEGSQLSSKVSRAGGDYISK